MRVEIALLSLVWAILVPAAIWREVRAWRPDPALGAGLGTETP